MSQPEDFRGPFLKCHRAETHIEEFRSLFARFINPHPYKAVANFDIEPGNIVWVARGSDPFPHDEFAPFIGDALQNLRSALDLAVSALMRNAGFANFEGYFPTGDSLNHFRNAIAKGTKNEDFPPELVAILEDRIQPYKDGNGCRLRVLHNLSIMDKHRLLIPTVFGAVSIRTDKAILYNLDLIGPTPIKDGAPLARMVGGYPGIKVNDEAGVTLTIAFDDSSGPLSGESVDDGMRSLLYATKEAIEGLERCLPASVDRYPWN